MDGEFDSPPSPPSFLKPYLLQEGPLRFPAPQLLVLARKRHPSEPTQQPVFPQVGIDGVKHCSQAPVPPGNRYGSPESPKIAQDFPGLNRIVELRHVGSGRKSPASSLTLVKPRQVSPPSRLKFRAHPSDLLYFDAFSGIRGNRHELRPA